MPSPVSATQRMVDAFRTNGWFGKVTTCHGDYCRGDVASLNWAWMANALTSTTFPPQVENDCGTNCSAFTYLNDQIPLTPFGWQGFMSGIMFVYDASPEVWAHMQCMGVTDSFTSARVCCTCHDHAPGQCPWADWPQGDETYCNDGPGVDSCTTDRCKQLAAGCGVSLFDLTGHANQGWRVGAQGHTSWGANTCTRGEVVGGECDACTVPYWCSDDEGDGHDIGGYYGRVRTAEQWINAFFDRDGGDQYGSRQCRMKPSQKQLFIDTIRLRYQRRVTDPRASQNWDHDHANTWNEVNAFVDGSGELAQALWSNLLGIVYLRTSGENQDLQTIQSLTAHWRELGVDVPMFRLSAESVWGNIEHWDPDHRIDLMDDSYSLEQIDPVANNGG